MNTRARDWLIGSILLGALIAWVQVEVGWAALLAPWRDMSLPTLLGLLSLSLLSYLLRALRLYWYFPELLGGRPSATIRLSVLHNAANNLLPMRAGEAVFPLLMKRYFGHGLVDSGLSLLWIRLLDLHVLLLVGLVAGYLARPHWLWGLAGLALIAALPVMFRLRAALSRQLAGREGRLAGVTLRIVGNMPRDGGRLARVYLATLLTWAAKFVAFTAVLLHFLPLPLWQGLVGVIGAELSSILPIHGIAGSGSYEAALVLALAPAGVDASAALAGAVNLHLFLLAVTLLLGGLALLLPRGRHS